ncbi:carbohydrate-binding module family 1 protein [Aaosphaeria arxii CBS 175.79]|uniref:AA9 family lytic polysaccharide monooxygenase n=1 Tax=Aaosphaeria arxii CBS 175.79 TaxID=1450172 RepID=A0A6A5XS16_9PLEO|nr:carbohydrate-binding module family 1 protein [Aaosphaeria arxii CBS 175.79]KAF2015551.1 carbohydrate-binding module family 1 protein [Aaosphaeria arxii CBS 175.79]
MKTATFLAFAAIGKLAAAHATFQEMLVNGKSQGSTGVRGTSDQNNPILSTAADLASDMMICKGGSKVAGSVSVASGDKLTLQWHHNNPSSGAGDADEPIAASHRGPIIVWVAKAETEGKGNAWVKIQQSGLSGGTWAVDTFRSNAGKIDVTVPDLAAGDYLIRSEIIALHEGDRAGKAQLYNGCGQIKVTSNGKKTITNGANIQSVYKTDDAGILFNIYGGASSYPIPGPAVDAGFGTGSAAPAPAPVTSAAPKPTTTKAAAPVVPKPTTLATIVKTSTAAAAYPTKGSSTGSVARWGQCGGIGYTGATACVAGSTCQKQNDWYFQCL